VVSSDLQVWDDNPSLYDLLGFDAVVTPIAQAINTPDVDPLTIGVHSPWGGGKSTVLNLLEACLGDNCVVIRTDPWQYDDHDDVRGDLITEVLDQVGTKFDKDGTVKGRLDDLRTRISWGRVGLALGKGALLMQWNPKEILEAFTPRGRGDDKSMAGFKASFETLIAGLPNVDRVVVLVDDLDRCLPPAVMATLESIKLFLAVPKMTFVIAADQDMVRDSIAAGLNDSNRRSVFASRYLEKIIQLPVSLPRVPATDAAAYIALLMMATRGVKQAQLEELASHCAIRRAAGEFPLLDGLAAEAAAKPTTQELALAAQLAQGLSAERVANPRQIKRFLNAYGVRAAAAAARGATLEPAVLIKMLLLEDQFSTSFEHLAQTPRSDRAALLKQWEAWGRGEFADIQPAKEEPDETTRASAPAKKAAAKKAKAELIPKPEGVEVDSKHWAGSGPRLAEVPLGAYIDLAASLTNIASAAFANEALLNLVDQLLGQNATVREGALKTLVDLDDADQVRAMEIALQEVQLLQDITDVLETLIRWTNASEAVAPIAVKGLTGSLADRHTPGSCVEMGDSRYRSEFEPILTRLARDDNPDKLVRNAAQMVLED
jgi:hypothetical protein